MTKTEHTFLMAKLAEGKDALVAAVDGVSDQQARFKPDPARWSILELTEHVAVTEEILLELISTGFEQGEPRPELRARDERLARGMLDRSRGVPAPEIAHPTGRYPTLAAALEAFLAVRARSIDYFENPPADLQGRFVTHPISFIGRLDCYQCAILLALHPARHAQQIMEVRSLLTSAASAS